jgi:tagaturonate reductase
MLKKLNRTSANQPQNRPVKILQFGEGNFLRAFVDWMVDVTNEKTDFNAGVQIVQPIAQGMGDKLNSQEGLYHVVLNGIQKGQARRDIRLVSCVEGVINPYENYAAFLNTAENRELRFVISNTTEAGISFNANDAAGAEPPQSFPAKLTAWLHHRYLFFKGDKTKAVTVLPCELIEKNGEALQRVILQYAVHWKLGDDFTKWIAEDTLFCNTLVDRIVPGFPKDNIKEIHEECGYEDNMVVMAEPFHLWVIEPKGSAEAISRLRKDFPLERAGLDVKFADDLAPYRTRKVRILNGAHTALVPVSYLRGLRTVREAVDNPYAGDFIRKAIEEEIIPTLDLPGEELMKFYHDVIERFENPFIRHELMSIALNSVSKFQVRVLPSVLEYIRRTGKLPKRLLHSLAALILFYKGQWKGQPIALNDTPAVLDFFSAAWRDNDPSAVVQRVLSNEEFWKTDLTKIQGLTAAVVKEMEDVLSTY